MAHKRKLSANSKWAARRAQRDRDAKVAMVVEKLLGHAGVDGVDLRMPKGVFAIKTPKGTYIGGQEIVRAQLADVDFLLGEGCTYA